MAAGTLEILMQHCVDTTCLQNAPRGEVVSESFWKADPVVEMSLPKTAPKNIKGCAPATRLRCVT